MLRYFLLWLPMIVIAFVNATLRELVLNKYFLPHISHQINNITLILFCLIYIMLIYDPLKIQTAQQSLWIGLLWALLTVLFEFGVGLFTGQSWENLLQQYNIASGELWAIFIFMLFIAPYVYYRVKNK